MFVSLPQYEFPLPFDLGPAGSQHWSMVELSFQLPWFMLSVEVLDAEIRDLSMIRTLCIALDKDLVQILPSLDAARVMGIVCMMPAWASPNSQWSAREVREVWLCTSPAGQSVLLYDAAGKEFDGGLAPEHIEPMEKELVLRVESPEPYSDPHSQRKTPPTGNRRGRRAARRKAGT